MEKHVRHGKVEPGEHKTEPGEHSFHHRFDDPEAFAKRLDAPERDAWQKPDQVIESFGLADAATVAEIGSGTGYFVVRLAARLKRGKVIGLDTEPKMVEYLRARAEKLGLSNVEARLAPEGGPVKLNEQVNLVLCVDTYHHISERVSYFARSGACLKAGGKLVIIDLKADSPIGPPAKHRIPPEVVKTEMQRAGFHAVGEPDFLPYQYYLAFEPARLRHIEPALPS